MTKTATVNYTPEMIETMTALYTSVSGKDSTDTERKEMVVTISGEIGKTVNSVRAKLSKLNLYIKPKPTTKSGVTPVRKSALVSEIATLLDRDEDLLGSLEKSTKFALNAVIAGLKANVITE